MRHTRFRKIQKKMMIQNDVTIEKNIFIKFFMGTSSSNDNWTVLIKSFSVFFVGATNDVSSLIFNQRSDFSFNDQFGFSSLSLFFNFFEFFHQSVSDGHTGEFLFASVSSWLRMSSESRY